MRLHYYAKLKSTKTREGLDIHWKDYTRIVNWMYELIGNQNGKSTEKCLEEIAKHVSEKEEKSYSVKNIENIYKFVTSGGILKKEIKLAQEFSCERIQIMAEDIRKKSVREGFHQGDLKQLTETEKSASYKLAKEVRLAEQFDTD